MDELGEFKKLGWVFEGNPHWLRRREEELELHHHYKAIIIGLGGIGSWMAFSLAAVFRHFILIDNDIVEVSNLHRTPYFFHHVGQPKVNAAKELIVSRNPSATVLTLNTRVEDLTPEDVENTIASTNIVLDCRDNISPLPPIFNKFLVIKLGYDGLGFNYIINPDYEALAAWDDTPNGYSIVPSAIAPPMILAAIVTQLIQFTPYLNKVNKTIHLKGDMYQLTSLFFEKFLVKREEDEGNENSDNMEEVVR
jgi:hypothetical protein